MTEPILRARNVTKSYAVALGFRRRVALASVDLEVRPGECAALLGQNGSGKSTLLRAAAGAEAIGGGTITIDGAPAGSLAAARALGYCPEESPFPNNLSARTALRDYGAICGLRGRALDARTDELLAIWGLSGEARTRVSTLSRGQLRRLSIAQAFLRSPKLLLLDEPTSGLDALGVVTLEKELTSARARDCAILLSSHLASDVENLCSRAIVLKAGRIAADGAIDAVFGDSARTEFLVEGADPGRLDAFLATAQSHGVNVVSRRPARKSLAQLFHSLFR